MTWQFLGTRFVVTIVAMALTAAVFGAPPVTTIQDILYKADGSPFEGVLIINWKTFAGPDTSNIPANSLTAQVVGGGVYVKLVPTTTAPTAAYYSVRYVADGAVQFTEFWSVPQSETALRIPDVRVSWPPAPPLIGAAEGVTIPDVIGLTDALNARPLKGITYMPSRAAVIGPTGELEAAGGSITDCIRVDGTSGPCGEGGGSVIGFVEGEAPAGAIDGVNSSFTLAGTPDPEESLRLFRNGLRLSADLDYTINGNAVGFLPGSVPQTGDTLSADYRF